MQAKLFRVKLKNGSLKALQNQVKFMRDNIADVGFEMQQKGYYWDSVFFETINNIDYMVVIIKSSDFSKTIHSDDDIKTTPSRDIYNIFKATCWEGVGHSFEAIFCFNQKMEFGA